MIDHVIAVLVFRNHAIAHIAILIRILADDILTEIDTHAILAFLADTFADDILTEIDTHTILALFVSPITDDILTRVFA